MKRPFAHLFYHRRSLFNESLPACWTQSAHLAWLRTRTIQRFEVASLFGSCMLTSFLVSLVPPGMAWALMAVVLLGYCLCWASTELLIHELLSGRCDPKCSLAALGGHGLVMLGDGGLLLLALHHGHGYVGGGVLLGLNTLVALMLLRQANQSGEDAFEPRDPS